MKTKLILIAFILTVLVISCKKETETTVNQFKFTSITGIKNDSTGSITMEWKDEKNTNWIIEVTNPDGTNRSTINWDNPQIQVSNLGLDSLYNFSVTGKNDATQSGSFNARIGTMGDVMVTN